MSGNLPFFCLLYKSLIDNTSQKEGKKNDSEKKRRTRKKKKVHIFFSPKSFLDGGVSMLKSLYQIINLKIILHT